MFFVVKGKCVHVGEAKQVMSKNSKVLNVLEFSIQTEAGKIEPQILKVSSWHGYTPKLNDQLEIGVKVSATVFNGQPQLRAEVV